MSNRQRVQHVVPDGEDTDAQIYELRDGEETPGSDKSGGRKPERTSVTKDGDSLDKSLASGRVSDESGSEDALTAGSVPVSAVVSEAVSDDMTEVESDTPPPPEDSEDDAVRLPIRFAVDSPQVTKAKPEWWTDACESLVGVPSS
jgi:hypothetical protein